MVSLSTVCPSWSTCLLSTLIPALVVITAVILYPKLQTTSPDIGTRTIPHTLPPSIPPMNDKPEMHLMLYIERGGHQEGLRIVEEVAADCRNLGRHLGLPEALVRSEPLVSQNDNCEKIISKWLEGRGKHPIIWRTFIDALEKVQLRLARELEMLLLQ